MLQKFQYFFHFFKFKINIVFVTSLLCTKFRTGIKLGCMFQMLGCRKCTFCTVFKLFPVFSLDGQVQRCYFLRLQVFPLAAASFYWFWTGTKVDGLEFYGTGLRCKEGGETFFPQKSMCGWK